MTPRTPARGNSFWAPSPRGEGRAARRKTRRAAFLRCACGRFYDELRGQRLIRTPWRSLGSAARVHSYGHEAHPAMKGLTRAAVGVVIVIAVVGARVGLKMARRDAATNRQQVVTPSTPQAP